MLVLLTVFVHESQHMHNPNLLIKLITRVVGCKMPGEMQQDDWEVKMGIELSLHFSYFRKSGLHHIFTSG